MVTIILENNTVGDITLARFGNLVIPGSGQLDITGIVSSTEFQDEYPNELKAFVDSGDITVNYDGTDLSAAEAEALSGGPPHAISHEAGGVDEIDLGALSGTIDDTQHGTRGGSTLHAVATPVLAGFMSSADKANLDSIVAGTGVITTIAQVRNESGAPIAFGKVVAVVGYSIAESRPLVDLADKDDPSRRPALGITQASIANNTNGEIIVIGKLAGLDTSAFSISDQLVLGDSGGVSRPPPDESPFTGEIQLVGSVIRVDAVNGEIFFVFGSGMEPVTADQVFALVGTTGTPSGTNKYVTNSDPRNTDARTPTAHAASHQNGGSDEISVAGLSGLLADPQTPLAHAASHQNNGSDEISVAGLSGLLADPQTPLAHAASHKHGGSDEVATAIPGANEIAKADGLGKLDSWISDGTTTTKGLVELATDGETNANVAVQGNDSRLIFGTQFQEGSSDGVSTTTSTTFQQKLRITTPVVPAGTYRIACSYNWLLSSNTAGRSFDGRIEVDDTTTIFTHQQRPANTDATGLWVAGGFAYIALTNDAHTIDLDYRTTDGAATATISKAKLEVWRVS